jgi:hypothetical protein
MNHLALARKRTSPRMHRTTPVLPVALILAAGCSSSTPNPGGSSGSDQGTSSGSSGSGSGSGSTSGGTSSSGSAAGSGSGTGVGSGSTSGGGAATDDGGPGIGDEGGTGSGSTGDGGIGGTGDGGTGGTGDGGSVTVSSCTKASAVCKADNTGCNVGSYYLYDNQWNCGAGSGNDCGPESSYGCTDGDGTVSWVTTSNQPKGNTAVLTYPAMQDNFNQPLLSSFKSITSSFVETSPGNIGDYEVAYDCWFNDNNANEFMIWVDTYKQVPAGSKVATGVSLGGHTYDIYWAPGSGTDGTVSFDSTTNFKSGTIDLLQLFNYATQHGWLPKDSTVDQLSFGQEVCSTDGQPATWTVSNYSITTN